jgi:ribosomal protein S18 acetylase RimI-like enzyme
MMRPVVSVEDAQQIFHPGSSGSGRPLINFFPNSGKLNNWIAQKQLFSEEIVGARFLMRRDGDFFHLYFCAVDPEHLVRGVQKILISVEDPVVVDLLGTEQELEMLAELYDRCQFQLRATLQRMTKRVFPDEQFTVGPSVVYGGRQDALRIHQLLLEHFDRFVEQIPTENELLDVADSEQLLVVKNDHRLEGFLFFERTGQMGSVRYWFVDDLYRGGGVGAKLMRTFFAKNDGINRVVLWVLRNNDQAIRKYEHYGFTRDRLLDYVMMKGIKKDE